MDTSKFYQHVGEFCVQFEEVCYLMEEYAMHILQKEGLQNRSIAKVLLSNLTAAPLHSMLQALLSEHLKTEEYKKILALAFTEFKNLTEARNSIIHAKWSAPIDDEDWKKPDGLVLSRKLKTNKNGEATQYLRYSEKDFIEHINTCIRLQKVMNYLCYLCDFPEKLSTYFRIADNKLLLPHEFGEFDAQPGSQEGLRE
ncbi:MAG: hypothetical protein PXX73_00225 [Sideroxydans sp.]|nr:hypothetical protein [Sideroxydans sp.]